MIDLRIKQRDTSCSGRRGSASSGRFNLGFNKLPVDFLLFEWDWKNRFSEVGGKGHNELDVTVQCCCFFFLVFGLVLVGGSDFEFELKILVG